MSENIINASPFFGTTTYGNDWSSGWSAQCFDYGSQSYLFLLKANSGDVHIHKLTNSDGTIGVGTKEYDNDWSNGWTTARFFELNGKTHLFLLKESTGDVHIHEMALNAGKITVGRKVFDKGWSSHWTSAEFFEMNGNLYLFLLKQTNGIVHCHKMEVVDGKAKVGTMVADYNWSSGWSSVRLFEKNNQTFLFLLKESGYSSDGNNVKIHKVNYLSDNEIEVGQKVYQDRWTEGWSSAEIFRAANALGDAAFRRENVYLFIYKKRRGTTKVHVMNEDGGVGTLVTYFAKKSSYSSSGPKRWGKDWSSFQFFELGSQMAQLRLKSRTGKVKIQQVNPMSPVRPLVSSVSADAALIWFAAIGYEAPPEARVDYAGGGSSNNQSISFTYRSNYYNPGTARLPNLASNTSYSFTVSVKINGSWIEAGDGSFNTAPDFAFTGTFKVGVASCSNLDYSRHTAPAGWLNLGDKGADLLLFIGDTAYPNTTERSMQWAEHLQQRGVPNYARMLAGTPTFATWDDHDFGPNNSSGADKERRTRDKSLEHFKELFPNLNYGNNSDALFYTFRWGPAEFFMCDVRYFRTYYKTDPANGKVLGDAQMDLLREALRATNATFKVVVLGTTLNGYNGTSTEMYSNYVREYQFFLDVLKSKMPGVFVVSGDIHRCLLRHHDLGNSVNLDEVISSGVANGSGRDPHPGYVMLEFNGETRTVNCKVYTRDSNTPVSDENLELNFSRTRLPISNTMKVVSTMAELKELDPAGDPLNESVFVKGFDSEGDGGGGIFLWGESPLPHLLDGVAMEALGGGSWVRNYVGPIHTKWAGVFPNVSTGTFDAEVAVVNQERWNLLNDFCRRSVWDMGSTNARVASIFLDTGVHDFDGGTVFVGGGVGLDGTGPGRSVMRFKSQSGICLQVGEPSGRNSAFDTIRNVSVVHFSRSSTGTATGILFLRTIRRCELRNAHVQGFGINLHLDAWAMIVQDCFLSNGYKHNLKIGEAGSTTRVVNCRIDDQRSTSSGENVLVDHNGGARNVLFLHCDIQRSQRVALKVDKVSSIAIRDCFFEGNSRQSGQDHPDIWIEGSQVRNVIIDGCYFTGTGRGGNTECRAINIRRDVTRSARIQVTNCSQANHSTEGSFKRFIEIDANVAMHLNEFNNINSAPNAIPGQVIQSSIQAQVIDESFGSGNTSAI